MNTKIIEVLAKVKISIANGVALTKNKLKEEDGVTMMNYLVLLAISLIIDLLLKGPMSTLATEIFALIAGWSKTDILAKLKS